MRKLVLLYKDTLDDQISIKEYSIVNDEGKYYILDEKSPYSRIGILKKYVDCICKLKAYPNTYPVELPYLVGQYWRNIVFLFVNKNKYEEDPIGYINKLKTYVDT